MEMKLDYSDISFKNNGKLKLLIIVGTRPDQLRRIAKLGLHVYAQSIFLDYDIHIVRQRAGDELADSSYSWRTLMNLGTTDSNGSDCPVENPDVLGGIQCAVTRQDLAGCIVLVLLRMMYRVGGCFHE